MILTFKPFLYYREEFRLTPENLPDSRWPRLTKVVTYCEHHDQEDIPATNCNCGVYSTIDLDKVNAVYEQNKIHIDQDPIPLIGVIQTLGRSIMTDKLIRSWGGFLWGMVIPNTDAYQVGDEVYDVLSGIYRPVFYHAIRFAARDIRKTWLQSGCDDPFMDNEEFQEFLWAE
jgi:hypothetical protein